MRELLNAEEQMEAELDEEKLRKAEKKLQNLMEGKFFDSQSKEKTEAGHVKFSLNINCAC